MTKDVLVSISGMQAFLEEAIELVVPGTYYKKNGKHYVFYEEQDGYGEMVTKNSVKFFDGHFEMAKKGGQTAFLLFKKEEKTSTIYSTAFGSFQIDFTTVKLTITETEKEIIVVVKYALDINYEYISDCEVTFKVQAR